MSYEKDKKVIVHIKTPITLKLLYKSCSFAQFYLHFKQFYWKYHLKFHKQIILTTQPLSTHTKLMNQYVKVLFFLSTLKFVTEKYIWWIILSFACIESTVSLTLPTQTSPSGSRQFLNNVTGRWHLYPQAKSDKSLSSSSLISVHRISMYYLY